MNDEIKALVERLNDHAAGHALKYGHTGICGEAAAALTAQADEIERLRKLDIEYGHIEAAIIMADPEFEGDSDHATCEDRLIASINRLAKAAEVRTAESEHRLSSEPRSTAGETARSPSSRSSDGSGDNHGAALKAAQEVKA